MAGRTSSCGEPPAPPAMQIAWWTGGTQTPQPLPAMELAPAPAPAPEPAPAPSTRSVHMALMAVPRTSVQAKATHLSTVLAPP